MANAQEKLTCVTCGGSFFQMTHAEQFLQGGYGTAEFRSLSNAPKTVLVCIGCSTPVTPKPGYYSRGTVAAIAEDEFRKSIEAGQKFRKDTSMQNIANIAASPAEVQEVRELVEDVKKAVDALAKPKGPKAKQEVKTAVGVGS